MSEIKLKRCPFCGGEAMHYGGGGQHSIRCKSCFNTNEKLVSGNMYTAFETAEEAAKDWNTRKPMERILKRLRQKEVLDSVAHIEGSEEEILTNGYVKGIKKVIEICKEEGGIE